MARAEESLMRRIHHIVLLVGLAALSPALTGCENFDMDKLDVFGLNEKKKLPGERKAVFPQGVPGVTQGIPQDLVKGNQPAPDAAQTPGAEPANAAAAAAPDDKAATPEASGKTAAVEPTEEPKPKPKPKKPRATTNPLALGKPAQGQDGGQQQTAPWPDANQQQPAQSPGQGQSS